jgi:uroporphyrinogen decarboxylase
LNYRKTVIDQINHRETPKVPYTLRFDAGSREVLDRYYGGRHWQNKIEPFIAKVWAVDNQYKNDIGDGRTRDIYGSIWKDDGKAAHLEEPVMKEPDLSSADFPDVSAFLKNGEFHRAEHECGKFPDSFRVVHIPWGLFERSWALRGFENALMDMVANESFYDGLLDRITEHLMMFVETALKLPIDGVMFGDDWGGQQGLLMGADRWRRFFKERCRRLFGRAREAGKKVLTHCCGNIIEIIPDVIEIGLDVYESFQPEVMDIYAVKREWGDRLTFWGGLGAQSVIPFGTPADIHDEIRKMKQELSRGGGFILAPAKEPPEETPAENLAALLESFTEG